MCLRASSDALSSAPAEILPDGLSEAELCSDVSLPHFRIRHCSGCTHQTPIILLHTPLLRHSSKRDNASTALPCFNSSSVRVRPYPADAACGAGASRSRLAATQISICRNNSCATVMVSRQFDP